ncbi:gas vesicle protein, partial [Micromonospora aurantiaca]|nr:gas vesicle protein [Micromonospora aurantiaca]
RRRGRRGRDHRGGGRGPRGRPDPPPERGPRPRLPAGPVGRPPMMSASEAAKRAVEHVTAMTGRSAESVVGIERAGDDGWRVTVEVVETRRIPDSADIL